MHQRYNSILYPSIGAKLVVLLIFYCTCSSTANAQEFKNVYSIHQWTTENGLSQNNVRSIAEDNRGFIWLGTYDGIIRFDGKEFKEYNEYNSCLTSGIILSLVSDNDGTIFLTTTNELVSIKDGHLRKLFEFKEGNNDNQVFKDDQNRLYLSWNEQLFRLENGKFSKVPQVKRIQRVFSNSSFYESDTGEVCSIERGECIADFGLNRYVETITDQLMVTTDNYQYVELFEINGSKLKKLDFHEKIGLKNCALLNSDIQDITTVKSGKVIVESKEEVLILNAENQVLYFALKEDLNLNKINAIHELPNGNLLIGTWGDGLFMFKRKSIQFHPCDRLNASVGLFIYQDHKFNIWMNGFNFNRNEAMLNSSNDEGENFRIQNSDGIQTWTMLVDQSNSLWCAGINCGVYKKNGNRFVKIPTYQNGLKIHETFSIYELSNGRVYVGTDSGIREIINDTIFDVFTESGTQFYQFLEDSKQRVWSCSNKGLAQIDESGNLSWFNFEGGTKNIDVRSIFEDSQGNFWAGTNKYGLFLLIDSTFTRVRIPNLSNEIWAIIEDDYENLWMSSDNGLYKINLNEVLKSKKIQNVKVSKFGPSDGMNRPEGNSRTQNKAFKDQKGRIWFSTIDGAVSITPSAIHQNIRSEKIYIDDIYVDGERLEGKDKIDVDASENNVLIYFSNIDFSRNESQHYEYKVEGIHKDWISTKNLRLINLSNLPSGDFEVLVRISDSDEIKRIQLSVDTFFWKETTFRVFLINALIILFVCILGRYLRKKKNEKLRYEHIEKELQRLRIALVKAQINPHFLSNCLSSIQSLFVLGDRKRATEYMSNFSVLMRMFLRYAERNWISLEEEIKMLELYLNLEALQLNHTLDYRITFDESINLETSSIPPLVNLTFVENAIRHGIKTSDSEGEICIHIYDKPEFYLFEISDNGVGIDAKKIQKLLSGKVRSGSMGIRITQKQLKLLYYLYNIEIKFDINSPQEGEGKGTLVKIWYPKRNSSLQ